jgi:putative RNA 2'-phosphotransferase
VHLSRDVPTALVGGRRRSANVAVFEVAADEMVTAGRAFHLSDNGVWLTAVVPPGYLALKRTNP